MSTPLCLNFAVGKQGDGTWDCSWSWDGTEAPGTHFWRPFCFEKASQNGNPGQWLLTQVLVSFFLFFSALKIVLKKRHYFHHLLGSSLEHSFPTAAVVSVVIHMGQGLRGPAYLHLKFPAMLWPNSEYLVLSSSLHF